MKIWKLLIAALIAVPVYAQDNQDDGWFNFGDDKEQQQEESETVDSEVIDRQQVDQQVESIGDTEIQQQEEEVKFQETQRVTQELIKKEQIPTIQVCNTYADINKMDAKDFQAIGFDQQAAQQIVQTREQKGRFESVDELGQIQGVDQQQLSKVKNDLSTTQRQAQEARQGQQAQEPQQQRRTQEPQQQEASPDPSN